MCPTRGTNIELFPTHFIKRLLDREKPAGERASGHGRDYLDITVAIGVNEVEQCAQGEDACTVAAARQAQSNGPAAHPMSSALANSEAPVRVWGAVSTDSTPENVWRKGAAIRFDPDHPRVVAKGLGIAVGLRAVTTWAGNVHVAEVSATSKTKRIAKREPLPILPDNVLFRAWHAIIELWPPPPRLPHGLARPSHR